MNTGKKTPDAEVMDILMSAFRKYGKGEEKHGVIDLGNDPRDFLKEAEDELLDAIVYMAFEISKLRRIRARPAEQEDSEFKKLLNMGKVTPEILEKKLRSDHMARMGKK